MLFLVDGYNVTKGDPATQGLTLESQREALVARLRVRGVQMLGRGRIVVVFDGEAGRAQGGEAGRSATHPIEVVYSRGSSADDAIVERASLARGEGVCVVTSDRGLAGRVREHVGAQVDVRPREVAFESARGAASAKKRRGSVAREAGLPPGANSITEEMKRHWLDGEE
jgi:predicted RNA-binding protein with PIN domain